MKISKGRLRKLIRESLLREWEEDCWKISDHTEESECEKRNAQRRFELEKIKRMSDSGGAFKSSGFMRGMSNVDRRVDVLENKVDQILHFIEGGESSPLARWVRSFI